MKEIYHALGLHFHQPLGNLVALHNQEKERWEARQILWAYDRPTRIVEGWEDVARLHFSFSGTLLKQLEDPGVRETFADAVDIGGLLDRYRRGPFEIRRQRSVPPGLSAYAGRPTGTPRPDGGSGWAGTFSAGTVSRASGRRRWASAWR